MESNLNELHYKEVISITDGTRYGYVGDLTFDVETGKIKSLIVPGQGKYFFGLFGKRKTRVISWEQIRRFGQDIILVEGEPALFNPPKSKKSWFAD